MKTKIVQFVPVLLVLLVIGFGDFSQWCSAEGHICNRTVLDQIIPYVTYPIYFFALYSLFLAVILVFVSRPIFNSWLKLAVWVVPLSLVLIMTTPVNWTGIGINFIFFSRDDMARLSGEVFTGLSLILIIWKYIALRRTGR